MKEETRYVGIDVAKSRIDVAVRPTGRGWEVAYDQAGIEELVPELASLEPALVLLEATGGLEVRLVAALASAALPVMVVNPRQVRDFARATGEAGEDRRTGRGSAGPLRGGSSTTDASSEGFRDPGAQRAGCTQTPGDDDGGVGEEPTSVSYSWGTPTDQGAHRVVGERRRGLG